MMLKPVSNIDHVKMVVLNHSGDNHGKQSVAMFINSKEEYRLEHNTLNDRVAVMLHYLTGRMRHCRHTPSCCKACDAREPVPFTFEIESRYESHGQTL